MTQPTTLPSATAQKAAALEVFAQYEPPLYEAYLEMMLEWMAAVKAAMFAGGVARLGLVPDPLAVFSQTPKWAALTTQYTAQVARDVLAAPYRDLFADDSLFESRPFVRNWIAQRENRLSQVPGEVFGLVSQVIDSATVNGATIPDVTAQVEQLFGDTSVPKWKNRARTVARTEVVGAYNGGLHDAFTMIVDNDPGTEWMHRWLATDDQRTRPDHVDADGQLQPFGHPFTVGGFQMMHPHDPDGPPQEVINCRCVELLEIKNDATKMDNRQYLGASFNPAEKRARDGKWTKGGLLKGILKGGKTDTGKATPTPEPPPRVEKPRHHPLGEVARRPGATGKPSASARTGAEALAAFPSASSATDEQKRSLLVYADSGFDRINQALAGLKPGDPMDRIEETDPGLHGRTKQPGVARKVITTIDSFMKPSTHPAVVYRGVKNPREAFGDLADGDMTGVEYVQKGYSSSSANEGWAATFSGSDGAILRLHVPAGIKGMHMDLTHEDEQEATLIHGLKHRIVGDTRDARGRRILDVEVIGHG